MTDEVTGPRVALTDAEIEAFFWYRVRKSIDPDGCWTWWGTTQRHSPMLSIRVGNWKYFRSARAYSLELAKVENPGEFLAVASCKNYRCVRPSPLHCHYSTTMSHRPKLSEAEVLEVLRRRVIGRETLKALAIEFGVSQTLICRIAKGSRRQRLTKESIE